VMERNRKVAEGENRFKQKEMALNQKTEQLERQLKENDAIKQNLNRQIEVVNLKQAELEKHQEEHQRRLEKISGLTADEARNQLVEGLKQEAQSRAIGIQQEIIDEAKQKANKEARKIIIQSIQRTAAEQAIENAITVFNLETDEIKGQIIGREGRNIRAFEAATGVDLIVDDTPEAVLISSHSPIRREIARVALERLISDGRIHPGRIEEVVKKAEQEVEESVREAGQRAVLELGVHGLHPEIIKLVGMLKYRYSYGQNVLMHSVETAYICGMMAAELGLNEKQARRAGLLHDIGKAVSHEIEGSHAIIGGEVARKYGESAKIVNAIAAHHEEVKAETVLAPLVDAADALSGARPGARREVLESYVRRLEALEQISNSFSGVEKSFALQAGREVRIMVNPSSVTDGEASVLAREVAKRIESEVTYPGQIRVTVIRETRSTEFAR